MPRHLRDIQVEARGLGRVPFWVLAWVLLPHLPVLYITRIMGGTGESNTL
jgi:hypothetical protein